MMRERGLILTGPEVRAVLDGLKTQHRVPVRVRCGHRVLGPGGRGEIAVASEMTHANPCDCAYELRCPFGKPGDRLWVREAWQAIHVCIDPETGYGADIETAGKIPKDSAGGYWGIVYRCTDPDGALERCEREFAWRSGATMPRWASRITLEVTSVRVETVGSITHAGVKAEGVRFPANRQWCVGFRYRRYVKEWNRRYAKRGFEYKDNPYTWVAKFRVLEVKS